MDRPELKIKLLLLDWLLEVFGIVAIILLIFIACKAYQRLNIMSWPFHHSKHGPPNPNTIFIFPVLSVLLYAGLSLMSLVPHTFKYPVAITPENAESEYRNGLRMLRIVKLSVVVIFLLLTIAISGIPIDRFL